MPLDEDVRHTQHMGRPPGNELLMELAFHHAGDLRPPAPDRRIRVVDAVLGPEGGGGLALPAVDCGPVGADQPDDLALVFEHTERLCNSQQLLFNVCHTDFSFLLLVSFSATPSRHRCTDGGAEEGRWRDSPHDRSRVGAPRRLACPTAGMIPGPSCGARHAKIWGRQHGEREKSGSGDRAPAVAWVGPSPSNWPRSVSTSPSPHARSKKAAGSTSAMTAPCAAYPAVSRTRLMPSASRDRRRSRSGWTCPTRSPSASPWERCSPRGAMLTFWSTTPSTPGKGAQASVLDLDLADLQEEIDIDIVAPLTLIKLLVPGMVKRGKGTVLNVTSGVAYTDPLEMGSYGIGYAVGKAGPVQSRRNSGRRIGRQGHYGLQRPPRLHRH